MSTLLRFLTGLIVMLYVQAAVFATVFTGTRSATPLALLLGVGIALVSMSPLIAGITVSYTTWSDEESRRRIRRSFTVLLLLQLGGAVLVVAAALATAVPVGIVTVVVVVGLALTPALIALGRAARRRDAGWRSKDEWIDTTRSDIRKGYRNAGIGFAIGLGGAVLLTVVLTATLDTHLSIDPQLVVDGVALAIFGAAGGMSITSFRIARRMREATGPEYGSMRRIGRVVLRGKPETLTEDEQRRAGRYAAVAAQWLPYQASQLVLLYTGIVMTQASGFFGHDRGMDPIRVGMIVLLVVVLAALVPLSRRRTKRARDYAATAS